MGDEGTAYQVLETALNPVRRSRLYDELMGKLEMTPEFLEEYLSVICSEKPLIITSEGISLVKGADLENPYPGLSAYIDLSSGVDGAKCFRVYNHGDEVYDSAFIRGLFRCELADRFRIENVGGEYYILCPTPFTTNEEVEGGFCNKCK